MRKRAMLVAALMSAMQVIAFAQRASHSADALLDLLVWGRHVTIDPTGYDPDVRFEIEQHGRRFTAYQSKRPVPRGSEMRMVHSAWVHYERLLAAASSAPGRVGARVVVRRSVETLLRVGGLSRLSGA